MKQQKSFLTIIFLLFLLLLITPVYGEVSNLMVDVAIPARYKEISPGEPILAYSDVILIQEDQQAHDINLDYVIKDKQQTIITSLTETKGGILRLNSVKEIPLSKELKPGSYSLEMSARYHNLTAVNSASFEIVAAPDGYSPFQVPFFALAVFALIIFLFGAIFVKLRHLDAAVNGFPSARRSIFSDRAASVPYPDFWHKEYTRIGLRALENNEFSHALEKMDSAIDEFNYDSALKWHHFLQARIGSNQFSMSSKEKKSFDRITRKLTALMRINQLHSCSQQKDHINLKHLLNELATAYSELYQEKSQEKNENEERFLSHLKKIHDTYARKLLK